VYSNASASVAFLENDAATSVTVVFQGRSVTLSPTSVMVYDAVKHTPVFDTFSVQAPSVQREFEQVGCVYMCVHVCVVHLRLGVYAIQVA
jgi:hypothetical protein